MLSQTQRQHHSRRHFQHRSNNEGEINGSILLRDLQSEYGVYDVYLLHFSAHLSILPEATIKPEA